MCPLPFRLTCLQLPVSYFLWFEGHQGVSWSGPATCPRSPCQAKAGPLEGSAQTPTGHRWVGPRWSDCLFVPSGRSCWDATVTKTFWPSCTVCDRPLRCVWRRGTGSVESGIGAVRQVSCCACCHTRPAVPMSHPRGTLTCPPHGRGGLPARQLTPLPSAFQGLLEDRSNQLFFGEVGRQMVTGLMTKAEKVAGGGGGGGFFFRFSSPSPCFVDYYFLTCI